MQPVPLIRRFTVLLAVASLFFLAARVAQADQTPQGWWLDETGKAGIIIAPCGEKLCGHVQWLREPRDAAGKPKTDIHNPDAALRPRPVCGLAILGGFAPDGSGGWQGGWIYDPSTGNTYRSIMHVAADGTLRVRGYIGVPLLGRSEVMTRPAAPLAPCAAG